MGPGEILRMVGAEMERRTRERAFGQQTQETGLEQAVFVMPALGPRIGEQDQYSRQAHRPRQRLKEFKRLSTDEKQVLYSSTVTLAIRAGESVQDDIDTQAELIGMCLRVRREVVPMPAADLQSKTGNAGQLLCQESAQRVDTLLHGFEVSG